MARESAAAQGRPQAEQPSLRDELFRDGETAGRRQSATAHPTAFGQQAAAAAWANASQRQAGSYQAAAQNIIPPHASFGRRSTRDTNMQASFGLAGSVADSSGSYRDDLGEDTDEDRG
jgi:hypothetical protein